MSGHSGPVIDSYVHHTWAEPAELASYLPRAWREFLGRPGSLPGGGGMMPLTPESPYSNPAGDKLASAYAGGAPGSNPETVREQLADISGAGRVVLGYDSARLIPVHPNHYLGRELIRAANDWTIDRWLSGPDDPYYGLILVPNALPEDAASEVRRMAAHPRMVGVLMGANGLAKPFGHPVYHTIYEAAYENGLPVVIHVGGDAPADTLSKGTAAGDPFTYAEHHLMAAHPLITHAVSLVGQGVFVKMPDLRVMLVGAGVTWLLTVVWRYDNEYKALRREVPWLEEIPSHYIQRNLRLTTYALDAVGSRQSWSKVFSAFPGLDEMVCYASGYPYWDTDTVASVASALPESLHEAVFHDNPEKFFRWSRTKRPRARAGAKVGAMGAVGGN
jgi:uncharacterized protein